MGIVTVTEGPGTGEEYEATNRAIEQEEGVPKPLVHIAGPIEGGFRVINVWASQADVDAVVKAATRVMQSRGRIAPGSTGATLKRTINPVQRLMINAAATAG